MHEVSLHNRIIAICWKKIAFFKKEQSGTKRVDKEPWTWCPFKLVMRCMQNILVRISDYNFYGPYFYIQFCIRIIRYVR